MQEDRAWPMVWVLAITTTFSYGILFYSFGVFIKPMETELGLSRSQSSLAFSMALLVAGMAAIPVGRYVDKHGARAVMTVGSILASLLVVAWSQVQSPLGLYLVWIAMGLAMSAVFYEVAFTVIAVWFRQERQKAMLLITLIAGLASTIFIPLETYLLTQFGWRQALLILAAMLALTIPLHAMVLRHKQHLRKETVKDIEARVILRTQHFWWLVIAIAVVRIAASAMSAHAVPLLLERGYTAAVVAIMTGSIGIMQLVGRIFFTPMTSGHSLFTLAIWTFGIHALGLAMLFFPGIISVWVFVLLFGASNGAITLARAGLLADMYGTKHYGQLNGVMALATSVVGALAPVLAGLLHDATGGYAVVLLVIVLTTLSSVGMMLLLKKVI
jgi:MFS family permease